MSKRKSVLMLGPHIDMQGGIASVINNYLQGGLLNVCDLKIISTACEGSYLRKVSFLLSAYQQYVNVIDFVDVIHIHVAMRNSFERKYIFAKIAKKKGKKIVLHEHDGEFAELYERGNKKYKERVKEFFSWADVVVVLSKEWADYFSDNICDRKKICVMHNAVMIPNSITDVYNNNNVLFLGRLSPRKNPQVLLEAASIVLKNGLSTRFRFAGDGDVEKYKAIATKLGIQEYCDFLGWVADKDRENLIKDSGIFCLPSQNEGMPMSLLEAMSYGLPCIVTPVGGIPQVIRSNQNGYLVDKNDVTGIVSSLNELITAPSVRVKIGKEARKTIEERFSISQNISRLAMLYEQL